MYIIRVRPTSSLSKRTLNANTVQRPCQVYRYYYLLTWWGEGASDCDFLATVLVKTCTRQSRLIHQLSRLLLLRRRTFLQKYTTFAYVVCVLLYTTMISITLCSDAHFRESFRNILHFCTRLKFKCHRFYVVITWHLGVAWCHSSRGFYPENGFWMSIII